jgi:hypothetical protein
MNQSVKNEIDKNIENYGYHMYLVQGGVLPRFLYSIGLSRVSGYELIFPGGLFYSDEDSIKIFKKFAEEILSSRAFDRLDIDGIGMFSLSDVDKSWSSPLMLGCVDYFGEDGFLARQIIPDKTRKALDVPDMSETHSVEFDLPWKWVDPSCECPVSGDSKAITNIDALEGCMITECARCETDLWELFSGAGPDVNSSDLRCVPLALLLASDPSLEAILDLEVGSAVWRDYEEQKWHPWDRKK